MSGTLFEIVTSQILNALLRGVVPWKKPWHVNTNVPTSLTTGKPYRGINTFLLGIAPYEDHRWVTFRQVQELGGKIKPKEQSTMVVFWKFLDPAEDEDGNPQRRAPILRYYKVWNVEQTEGLSVPELPKPKEIPQSHRCAKAELLIEHMPNPPKIVEGGSFAWYKPSQDLVQIPKIEHFESVDRYYTTLMHELAHATGHVSRLNRPAVNTGIHFGSGEYGKEELVAELTAAFCAAEVGLDNSFIEDSASYIDSWLSVLRNDPKAIVFAAAQAQKAADYIKGVSYAP